MTIDENITDADEVICIANEYGRILMASKSFCKMFGFKESDIVWHYLRDLYRHRHEFNRAFDSVLEREEVWHTKMRTRNGRTFRCLLTRRPTHSREGIPLQIHSVQRLAH